MEALADKGVELLRLMRAGIVTGFDANGIFVSKRWRALSDARRAEVCAALRIRDDEVRPVVDAATGRELGTCDDTARFAPAPDPPPERAEPAPAV